MTFDELLKTIDLSDKRYSADGKTLRRPLIPYFKKKYPELELSLPSDFINSGLPILTPDDFLQEELAAQNRRKRFLASTGGSYTYPKTYDYQYELGRWHDQKRNGTDEGTCYVECTSAYVEWWLWMKTGHKINVSDDELRDAGGDSNGVSYASRSNIYSIHGGWPQKSLPALYNYNSNLNLHYYTNKQESESLKLFKQLVDDDCGGFYMRTPPSTAAADLKEFLFRYGPCALTFDGHATLFCGYDETNVYRRDSYYNSYDWKTPQAITWEQWPNRARSVDEFVALRFPHKNV